MSRPSLPVAAVAAGDLRTWPKRPSSHQPAAARPLGNDGARIRSTPAPGPPGLLRPRVRPRRQRAPWAGLILLQHSSPAWAMSAGTTRQTAAGPTSTPRPRSAPLPPGKLLGAFGHDRPAPGSPQGYRYSPWLRAGGPRNDIPGRPRRQVRPWERCVAHAHISPVVGLPGAGHRTARRPTAEHHIEGLPLR